MLTRRSSLLLVPFLFDFVDLILWSRFSYFAECTTH
jgi:hypothetical protein